MDRRQRKTRDAIFKAFIALLSHTHYEQITVGAIIEEADIGRSTFYAHFETKDALLHALCKELFAHIFETNTGGTAAHSRIFDCDETGSVALHLLTHLQADDNHIAKLLLCPNNDLFLRYFKEELMERIQKQSSLFCARRPQDVPEDFWIDHAASVFVNTVWWWASNGMREPAETICRYYLAAL